MAFIKQFILLGFLLLNIQLSYSQDNTIEYSETDVIYNKGVSFFSSKQYDSVNYYLHKALKTYKKNDNSVGIVKTYIKLNSLKTFVHSHDSAMYYLIESKHIAKNLKDKKIQAEIYLNIAHINFKSKNIKKALLYAHLAESIQEKVGDLKAKSKVYNNLAILYRKVKKYNKALAYNLKTLDIKVQQNDSIGISRSYNNIGLLKDNLGEFDSATIYLKRAITINNKLHIKNSFPYRSLGALYLKTGNHKLSNAMYLEALAIEKPNNVPPIIIDIYKKMLTNYLRLNDIENAIKVQTKYYEIEEENFVNQNLENDAILESQLELFQKERELEKEKLINEKDRIVFFVVFDFLIIAVIFLLQSKRTSQLKRKKDRLLLESKILRAQMNPHFIFNALGAIQNSLMKDNPLQTSVYLSRFSKLMRQNFEFVNKDRITLREDIDALKNYIETQLMRYDNIFDYSINVDTIIDIFKVEIPPLLIQPFVENSIEHGFETKKEKGRLQIDFIKENHFLLIKIIDNGIGFNPKLNIKGEHSVNVVKKRLRLISRAAEKSFSINSSSEGTEVCFKINI